MNLFNLFLPTLISFTWPSIADNSIKQSTTFCFNQNCYALHLKPKPQQEAQKICEKEFGGRLAVVEDDEIWDNISKYILDNLSSSGISRNSVLLGIQVPAYQIEPKTVLGGVTNISRSSYWPKIRIRKSERSCLFANVHDNWRWCLSHCSDHNPFLCEYRVSACNLTDLQLANADFTSCLTAGTVAHNTVIEVECWLGHQKAGPATVSCSNGKWSEFPECIAGCPPPPPRPNAKMVTRVESLYPVGHEAVYVCSDKSVTWTDEMKTHFRSVCGEDGDWSEPDKGCIVPEIQETRTLKISTSYLETLMLKCTIGDSNNTVHVHWIKYNSRIIPGGRHFVDDNGTLLISNATTTDVGLYYCFIKEYGKIQIGKTFYRLKMNVACPVTSPLMLDQHVEENKSAILFCHGASIDHPVKWYLNNEPISSNDQHTILLTGTLLIHKARISDVGQYVCDAFRKGSDICTVKVIHKIFVKESTPSVCGIATSRNEKEQLQPWLVTFWKDSEIVPFCYGTIIDTRWVITTAFCLKDFRRKQSLGLTVQVGRASNVRRKVTVSSVKIHPSYRQRLNSHDIALAKLQGPPVEFSADILPLCLSTEDITHKYKCQMSLSANGTVSGFGSLESDDVNEMNLTVEKMTLVENSECEEAGKFGYTGDMFCAKQILEEPNYAGDTGSPFVVHWKGRNYLRGIYSWGERAAGNGLYDYFVNTAQYHDWIHRTIAHP